MFLGEVMKIVFAGTPDFALSPLQAIADAGFEIVGVVTQPDKPQGRKNILTPPPVKTLALERGFSVLQPEKLKEDIAALKALCGDVMVTCAYGQILTQEVLNLFPLGVWNIHAGLLPAYRGASPIQSCILAGETQTGVTVMRTELGLDTGDILLEERTDIGAAETYGELSSRLSNLGAALIVRALKAIENGEYALQKQAELGANTVRKIKKEQAALDFSKDGKTLINTVRAFNPAPVAYTFLSGVKLNVYAAEIFMPNTVVTAEAIEKAAFGEVLSDSPKQGFIVKCKGGAIKLLEVQLAGGKRMKGGDFLNGRKAQKGQVLPC